MPLDWSPLWLSLRYAGLATAFAALVALPLAWLLTHRHFPAREMLAAFADLPLLLPPAVLVYYLLSELRRWPLRFSWRAAIVVSAIYTLPVLLRMMRAGLEAPGPGFENAARSLGAGEWRVFLRVTLPLAWRALLTAILVGFVRAFVDFGATLIVARGAATGLSPPFAALATLGIALHIWRPRVAA
ncbi:MAG: molybdate ABC transporter permease subunit [Bryobacteraceae bacterium]